MRRSVVFALSFRVSPLCVAALLLVLPTKLPAQIFFPIIPIQTPETPKKFSPDVEAKMKELIERITTAKGKIYDKRMAEMVQEVVKVTGLDPEKAKALENPAHAAAA